MLNFGVSEGGLSPNSGCCMNGCIDICVSISAPDTNVLGSLRDPLPNLSVLPCPKYAELTRHRSCFRSAVSLFDCLDTVLVSLFFLFCCIFVVVVVTVLGLVFFWFWFFFFFFFLGGGGGRDFKTVEPNT